MCASQWSLGLVARRAFAPKKAVAIADGSWSSGGGLLKRRKKKVAPGSAQAVAAAKTAQAVLEKAQASGDAKAIEAAEASLEAAQAVAAPAGGAGGMDARTLKRLTASVPTIPPEAAAAGLSAEKLVAALPKAVKAAAALCPQTPEKRAASKKSLSTRKYIDTQLQVRKSELICSAMMQSVHSYFDMYMNILFSIQIHSIYLIC
eukprot:SAG11_NODE_4927_length_1720_cov_1.256015_2_plen_204_part_00